MGTRRPAARRPSRPASAPARALQLRFVPGRLLRPGPDGLLQFLHELRLDASGAQACRVAHGLDEVPARARRGVRAQELQRLGLELRLEPLHEGLAPVAEDAAHLALEAGLQPLGALEELPLLVVL